MDEDKIMSIPFNEEDITDSTTALFKISQLVNKTIDHVYEIYKELKELERKSNYAIHNEKFKTIEDWYNKYIYPIEYKLATIENDIEYFAKNKVDSEEHKKRRRNKSNS